MASSLTTSPPGRPGPVDLEQLHRENADDAQLPGDAQREPGGRDGGVVIQAGRGGDHLDADAVLWTVSTIGQAAPARTVSARPGRPARGAAGRTTRRTSCPAPARFAATRRVRRRVDHPDPAAVVSAAGCLHHHRPAVRSANPRWRGESRRVGLVDDRERRHRHAELASRVRISALSCAYCSASAPGYTACPSAASARMCSPGTCS